MTTTEHEPRYFHHIRDNLISFSTSEYDGYYVESPYWREMLITLIPEIEVDEPDEYGVREVSVGGVRVGGVGPYDTAAYCRETRDGHLRAAGKAEAVARWLEANPQSDPESVARVQAARDALAVLTDEEREEALR